MFLFNTSCIFSLTKVVYIKPTSVACQCLVVLSILGALVSLALSTKFSPERILSTKVVIFTCMAGNTLFKIKCEMKF